MRQRVAGVDDLQDGQMKAVEVGGKKVLLARVQGRFYATGARCPHWGGSLPDGILHGKRVVCPLHGGTFDVCSGDLLEPPPMDAVASFPVHRHGSDVYVERPDGTSDVRVMPMCRRDPRSDARLFVIVGGGGAAAAAAEMLRQEGYEGRLVVVGDEGRRPYDRPKLSKDYVAGTVSARLLPLREPEFYEERDIEFLHGRVASLDVEDRLLALHDGRRLNADAVLIATGGLARGPEVTGASLPGVFTLRSWADADALAAACRHARRAVVIGSGFIGMEVAAGLVQRGLEVTVVGRGGIPLERALGPAVGGLIRSYHEERGTRFALRQTAARLIGDGRVAAVELDDGRVLPADVVVIGRGIRPATSFVRGAALSPDGGVPVDDRLRAAPLVWAAGDAALFPEPYSGERARIEHWRVAQQHGRAAARAMAGRPEPFSAVPFFWTQQFLREVFYAGRGRGSDELIVQGDMEKWDFVAYYARGDRLVAACGTRGKEVGAFMELMRVGGLPAADALRGSRGIGLAAVL